MKVDSKGNIVAQWSGSPEAVLGRQLLHVFESSREWHGEVAITAVADNFRSVRFGPRIGSYLVALNGGVVKILNVE
jgi:hypothetical protein